MEEEAQPILYGYIEISKEESNLEFIVLCCCFVVVVVFVCLVFLVLLFSLSAITVALFVEIRRLGDFWIGLSSATTIFT